MTKKYEFNWRIPVPEILITGCMFDRWTEDKESYEFEPQCMFKVDEYGFFIYWKSASKSGDVLEISQVCDIRYGGIPTNVKLLNQLTKQHGDALNDKSLNICTGLDYVNINYVHVICPDADTAKQWQAALQVITNRNKPNNVCPRTNLMKHWMRLSFLVDAKGKVPVKVISKTFASGKTEKLVYQSLQELGLPNGKSDSMEPSEFTFEKFYTLYHKICPRNDIDELFQSIAKGDSISLGALVQFMNERQRDPQLNEILYPLYTDKRCTEIINDYEKDEKLRNERKLSKEGLIQYLMSDENAPVFLDRLEIFMDMDQPLAHYYINSSHNTYLSGKQFGGKSSVEMYRQTMLAGCRCVELDCWDGKGEDEEPIITHGKAMCTDILYKDVIYALRDTAFITSEYPIILSFENHCCKSQQYKMAKYCDEIFGDLLLKEPLPEYPLEPGAPLAPPSMLKRKILIKNKRLKPEVEKAELELFMSGQFVITDEQKEDSSEVAPEKKEEEPAPDAAGGEAAPGGEAGPDGAPVPAHTGSTTSVHPWLSSMINYAQPIKFQGFDVAEKKNIHHNMSSFAEPAGLNYIKNSGIEFVNYNKRQMSRIYPKGTRVDSSNYMPQVFWNAGCQMVSLNYQTPDLPMQLNQGKFEYNGNCGYLLKPEFMRKTDKTFDPFAESSVDGVIAVQCSVQVIAGQFLSDKKVGTYVEVDMYGLPADTIRKEFRTRMVPANGLNPVYNEDAFLFRKVVMPDLAVLRFGVFDEGGKLLGQRILPLDGLQCGYRHISLRTEGNFPMALPMLFACIELKIYIPDGFGDFMSALSDPKGFAGAQAKRNDQMKSMGIEESKAVDKAAEEKKKAQEIVFDEITVESLRAEKGYAKVGKKQQKDVETMRKKQLKERQGFQKTHTAAVEKIGKGKKPEEAMKDAAILKMVKEQTQQWSEMVERHLKEEWSMNKQQLKDNEEFLKKLLVDVQAQQVKQLEIRLDKDQKELIANQSKVSVETAKEIANDKTLKTKNDKDRRLKEKQQNNTKKFMEERKTAKIRENKMNEKLKKKHEGQNAELTKEIQALIDMYEVAEAEFNMSAKNECYV